MATGMDQVMGLGMSAGGILIFIYYSVWILILPFVETSHVIYQFFLPRAYAVIIPVIAGVCLLTILCIFAAYILFGKKKKKE
ncbi:dolichol phosphate-mannose biosynthesis regulatory protein-like [Anneissia japonica]|uniref:dolichol phosphate-mannose biosynthesis regulatory protein-like n=1 Tax=Anneissia japonica TaxID=1529436 RepID=UPI001425B0F8|nr:dolichol phosphate-mannose biosynthesis regulatory protein-like [Anneissia japonica]